MDLWLLKPGHKIRAHDGAEAEVLSETRDGEWIRVRYFDAGDDPLFGGTETLAHRDEVETLLGVVHGNTWAENVTVVLHHVPESEESEGAYEALSMKGVPFGVSISSSDPDTAAEALDRLLAALREFGFRGRVSVEDATHTGGIQRYEVEVS